MIQLEETSKGPAPLSHCDLAPIAVGSLARDVPTLRYIAAIRPLLNDIDADRKGKNFGLPSTVGRGVPAAIQLDDCEDLVQYDPVRCARMIGAGRCQWQKIVRDTGPGTPTLEDMSEMDGTRLWSFLNRATVDEIDSMDCE